MLENNKHEKEHRHTGYMQWHQLTRRLLLCHMAVVQVLLVLHTQNIKATVNECTLKFKHTFRCEALQMHKDCMMHHKCKILHWKRPWLDLTWFIQHPRCIGPHVDAMSVCFEPMLQPLPRLIPFFVDPCSLYLSSLTLVYQVFSWILQLPIVGLASECVLHPFLWHDLAKKACNRKITFRDTQGHYNCCY